MRRPAARWTEADDARLRSAWRDGKRSASRICAEMQRSWGSIRHRAARLGLQHSGIDRGRMSRAAIDAAVSHRRERVVAAFKAGSAIHEIADVEGVCRRTIHQDLDATDPLLRRKQMPHLQDQKLAQLVAALHDAGVDKHKIAAATGLSLTAVEARIASLTCKARLASQAQADYRAAVGPVSWPKVTMTGGEWPADVVFEDVDPMTLLRETRRMQAERLPQRTEVSSYMGNAGAMCAIQQGAI